MNEAATLALPLAAGIALAAAAGLRAFLPLGLLAVAAHFDWITLSPLFSWLDSTPALIALATACILEVTGDKIPAVDHALDAVGTVVRPLAGALAVAALLTNIDPLWANVLAIVVGGGTAGVVHLAKAKTRVGSSLLSMGCANPFISVLEDLIAGVLSFLAVLVPVLAAALVVGLLWLALRLARALTRTSSEEANPTG